jgi:hypothetical protein
MAKPATTMSDLVLDSRLNTRFLNNGRTRHTYIAASTRAGVRADVVEDTWHRRRKIGIGGTGEVWAEVCESGPSKGSVRAVKTIRTGDDYGRATLRKEVEAMTKFSHARVGVLFPSS